MLRFQVRFLAGASDFLLAFEAMLLLVTELVFEGFGPLGVKLRGLG